MCRHQYEALSGRTGKPMLFCLRQSSSPDTAGLAHLCTAQRWCPDKDRYLADRQQQKCKYFE